MYIYIYIYIYIYMYVYIYWKLQPVKQLMQNVLSYEQYQASLMTKLRERIMDNFKTCYTQIVACLKAFTIAECKFDLTCRQKTEE